MTPDEAYGGYIYEQVLDSPLFTGVLRFIPARRSGTSTMKAELGVYGVKHGFYAAEPVWGVDFQSPGGLPSLPPMFEFVGNGVEQVRIPDDLPILANVIKLPLRIFINHSEAYGDKRMLAALDVGLVHITGETAYDNTELPLVLTESDMRGLLASDLDTTPVYYYPVKRKLMLFSSAEGGADAASIVYHDNSEWVPMRDFSSDIEAMDAAFKEAIDIRVEDERPVLQALIDNGTDYLLSCTPPISVFVDGQVVTYFA